MFRFFRKIKRLDHPAQNKMTGILSKPIRQAQTRFATVLSKQERRLSNPQKKKVLFLFILGMTSLSGYWVYQGIFSKSSDKPGLPHYQGITQPKNATLPDSLDIKWLQEYKHWRQRKDSLPDSLHR
jgi:hypothetical protein